MAVTMRAKDMMIKDVYFVGEHATVRDVVRHFISHRISGLPVVKENGELCGYISDGDIMRYIGKHQDIIIDSILSVGVISADDRSFSERAQEVLDLDVHSITKRKIITIDAEAEAEDVAAVLGKKQIKKLPVTEHGKLVGIISRGDVIRNTFEKLL